MEQLLWNILYATYKFDHSISYNYQTLSGLIYGPEYKDHWPNPRIRGIVDNLRHKLEQTKWEISRHPYQLYIPIKKENFDRRTKVGRYRGSAPVRKTLVRPSNSPTEAFKKETEPK